MALYDVTETSIEWSGKLSRIRVDHVVMPGGETVPREVAEHIDAVAIVALTPDDEVVLLRQYRHPLGGYQLELPAGILDEEGESHQEAVRRELAEEAGMHVENVQQIARFANSAGWSDEHTTLFVGTGARRAEPPAEFEREHEEADMELVMMPFSEALDMAVTDQLTDAKTLMGILLVAAHRARG